MTQPNWRTPLLLSALLLIFGSFTYWFQYSHKPKQDRLDSATKKPLVLPSEDTQVVQFRIKGAAQVIEGKCDSLAKKTCKIGAVGEWSITYPRAVKGDADAIKDFLNNITAMTATETIDLSAETTEKRKALLDEYGLSAEKRTKLGTEFVELTLDNGKKIAAWFGELHPVGDKVFVGSTENGTLNENTVFLIANFYKSDFDKQLTHFRDKTILSFERSEITEFEASTTGGKLIGVKDNNLWKLNGKPGDYDRIETVLSSLSQVKAKNFPVEDVLKGAKLVVHYAFKSKVASYFLDLYENTTPAVKQKGKEIVPAKSRYYVKSSQLKEVVEVEPGFRSQIDKKSAELRQGLLVSQTEKATAIEVKIESKDLAAPAQFHYNGKVWTLQDQTQKLDAAKVAPLLEVLSAERALDIVSPVPLGATDKLTVSVGDEKNPAKSRYLFFITKDPGKIYAQDLNQPSNEAYLLDESIKIALPFPLASWKMK